MVGVRVERGVDEALESTVGLTVGAGLDVAVWSFARDVGVPPSGVRESCSVGVGDTGGTSVCVGAEVAVAVSVAVWAA